MRGRAPISDMLMTCLAGLMIGLPSTRAGEALQNSSRECAICHIRWVDALVRTESQTEPMEKVLERQAGSGDMCLSCHDGSVADSRFKIWSTRHHTTGQVPSPKIKIPTDRFPLDAQGRMTCSTCHTAHAVSESSDIRTVVFLRQPNVDSSLCLACHGSHAQINDVMHPVGHMEAPVPKVILEAGGKTSEDGHSVICQTCHEPHGARNDWMLVLPPSKLCIACHTDKDPDMASQNGMPFHKIGKSYAGFEPPVSLLDKEATFGPENELTCLSCHRLHDASGAKPLLIQKNEDSGLCVECHTQEKAMYESPHDLRRSAPDIKNAKGETPSESGPCGVCHRIHGWARDVHQASSPHSAGCLECHETGGPGSHNRPYMASHPLGIPLPEGQTTALPLDETTGSIGCLTCHNPHTPLHETEVVPDEPAPRSFLRLPGSQLCVECHSNKTDARFSAHDPVGFTPELRQSLSLNAAMGSCRVCHSTHNAKGPHLWSQTPRDSQTETLSGLCQACHSHQITEPAETNHPDVTSRSLTQKLGDAMDSDTHTGCGACHDPHAGPEQPALLRQGPEALCVTCHDRERGVTASVHDPNGTPWANSLGFDSQSLCLDCHPVHVPKTQGRLWQALGGQAETQLCSVCHSPGKPGLAVETPHVGQAIPSDPNAPHARPLMESHSQIRCSTCHNIHQAGQTTWLLKAPVQDGTLCLTCHPEMSGVLGTHHDLRQSGPDVENIRNERPEDSGPCGVCHKIHGTASAPGVWARTATVTWDYGRHLCTDCHKPGQNAEARIPDHTGHPDLPLVNRTGLDQASSMPTFTPQGESSLTGSIACQTCHDPHLAPSGNPRDHRFLRTGTQQKLCVACHDMEGLWRYLYYHQEKRKP
ncbi:MAG: cytochrome c3 family protein [Phycisphaerae bacterium]|nr:cytochrome c3 family protein [Phycisphaerae bacterium]